MPTITSTVGSRVGSVTGSISGNVLTVSSVQSGSLGVGQKLTGSNVAPNTYITGRGTGTGGVGTYYVGVPQTIGETAISAARDYATLPLWVASIPTDMVTDGNSREALVYNDGEVVFATANAGAYIDFPTGMVMSAACHPIIKAAPGERVLGGRLAYDPANGPAIRCTGFNTQCLRVPGDSHYVEIEGLQFKHSDEYVSPILLNGPNSRMSLCIVDGNRGTYANVELKNGATIANSFVLNRHPTTGRAVSAGVGGKVFNCTLVRPSNLPAGSAAFACDYSQNTIRNTLALGFTELFLGSNGATTTNSGNNVCSGTSSVAGDIQNVVYADQVVQPSTVGNVEDFKLKAGSAAINAALLLTGINSNQYDYYGSYRQTPDVGAYEIPETANALLVSGPTTGIIGQPSTPFTVQLNGVYGSDVVISLSDAGAGGTFTPASVTIPAGQQRAEYTYTASSGGAKTLSMTNDSGGAIANPAATTYTASVTAPTGAVTTQPPPDGQTVVVNFNTANTPTSGTAVLSPAVSNPNGAVQATGVVNLVDGAGTATFTGVVPGNYQAPLITITNSGGSATVTGTTAVVINGITGNVDSGDGVVPTTTVPGIPTAVVAVAGDGVVTVNCTPPSSNGGSPITSWRVTASTGQTVEQSALPITISMPNGIAATFRMQAINAIGASAMSEPSNSVVPSSSVSVPTAPQNVTAVAGPERITVSFDPPASNGGAAIIDYTVTLSTGEQATGVSSPIAFVGIQPGIARTATVRARNAAGNSAPSAASNEVTPTSPIAEVTGISILPQSAVVPGGSTIQFTKIVLGINGPSQDGVWSADLGIINASGLYTAPPAAVIGQIATITFTSLADPSFSASVNITIPAQVSEYQTPVRHYDGNVMNAFGVAIEGARVTVFNTDTGEKAILWSDKTMTDELENPLITDDHGFFEFYVEAVQCFYTVRGNGIRPYTRNDIFDIVNNVDLGPITASLQNLEQSKVSTVQLQEAVSELAPKARVDNVEQVAIGAGSAAQSATERIAQVENIVPGMANDIAMLKEQVGKGAARAPVDVKAFATSGNGTSASPWVGWDTAITWTAGVQYDFEDGFYDYNVSPNFGRNFLTLNGRKNAILRHKGTGPAIIIDSGSGVVACVNVNIRVQGNANSEGGLFMRGIVQSKLDIDFNDIPGAVVIEVSCLLNDVTYKTSPTQRGRTIQPVNLLVTARRNTELGCGGNKYNLLAENCSGSGVIFDHCFSSSVNVVAQYNGTGIDVRDTCREITFRDFVSTLNTDKDLISLGVDCSFINGRVGRRAEVVGARTRIQGGVYDHIRLAGINSSIRDVVYGSNGGFLDMAALGLFRSNTYNLSTGKFDTEVINPLQSLSVAGKTTLSADTLDVGGSQLYKTPSGQICFGTSQPNANARFTLYNPENSATDLNLYSVLQSFSTTAYHYKANSGGGTDVFMIAGNGNTTNLNNSYAAISDERLKENITDATPKLEKMMQVRVVNYNLIDGDGEKLLGVLAGELEQLFPNMIHTDANGIKSVKYSVFVPMIIKTLQEMRAEYLNQ